MSPQNLIHWMASLKRHGTLRRATAPVIDALESRLLLATSCPGLTQGVMTVNGDGNANTIVIRTVGGTIEALDGGSQASGCSFTQSQVTAVVVNASDGNDSVGRGAGGGAGLGAEGAGGG